MKQRMTRTIAFLLSILMLIGCGSNRYLVDKVNEETEITFSWWGNDTRHEYTMDGVDIFNASNDSKVHVDCRYGEWSGYERKNNVWMESDTQADVMQINYAWLDAYSKDGTGYYDMYQLTDYIDLSGFDESDLTYGEVDGKLNAIPIAFNTSTICFNKDIYDEYGLEIPKTWDDFFEAAKVLSQHDIYVLGMAKKHLLLMLIAYFEQTTGKHVFKEDGTFSLSRDEVGVLLDFYKRLIDEKVLMPIDQFDRTNFAKGECSASLFWISDADNYCGALSDNGYTPLISDYPMATEAHMSGLYMKPATMYAISDTTSHPEAAATFVNFLLNNADMVMLQGTEKGVPVSKKAVSILESAGLIEGYGYDAYNQMQLSKSDMSSMIPNMENEGIIDAFKLDADAYIYGVSDREETLTNIYSDIKAALAE